MTSPSEAYWTSSDGQVFQEGCWKTKVINAMGIIFECLLQLSEWKNDRSEERSSATNTKLTSPYPGNKFGIYGFAGNCARPNVIPYNCKQINVS